MCRPKSLYPSFLPSFKNLFPSMFPFPSPLQSLSASRTQTTINQNTQLHASAPPPPLPNPLTLQPNPRPLPRNLARHSRNLLKRRPQSDDPATNHARIHRRGLVHQLLGARRAIETHDEVMSAVVQHLRPHFAPCEQEGAPVCDSADYTAVGEHERAGGSGDSVERGKGFVRKGGGGSGLLSW